MQTDSRRNRFMSHIDKHSYDLSAVHLTLRHDLSFRRQDFGIQSCYVIEDPARSIFFRVGHAEYTFLSLLDGRTSIAHAVAEVATLRGDDAFSETEAAALCSWLIENHLATTPESHSSERYISRAAEDQSRKARQWMNPVMLRIPLGNPNELIRAIAGGLAWIFGWIGFGLWLPTVLIGIWCLMTNWGKLSSAHEVLAADNWVWLGLTWLGLKLVHELSHGLVCRRYGGDTREAGVILLLFVPLPYVDVTSSWRFGSRWQRMYTAAAGMYAELFVAAAAAIVFSTTDSPIMRFHAVNVLTTAGFMTLMFNINPLMRFDGYYILADALNLPNLAMHGHQDLLWMCRRGLLGVKAEPPQWPEGRGGLIRLYGILACLWKLMLCVSLTAAAALMFRGAGIAIAAAALTLWIVVPVARFCRYLIVGDAIHPPQRLRFASILTALVVIVLSTLNWVPWIERQRYAAVVDYDPVTSVRSSSSGFVRQIHVQTGQVVTAGTVLVTLENRDLAASVLETELSLEKSALEAARFHQKQQLAAFQVELENQKALRRRLAELRQQQSDLVIQSPETGRVLTHDLAELEGRWMQAGTEVASIGDSSRKALHFTAAQSELPFLNRNQRMRAHVHIWGQAERDLAGVIAPVDPRASTLVRFPALTTYAGGPLSVRAVESTDGRGEQRKWELLEPHFCGTVNISPTKLNQLGIGQTGYVEITTQRGSVGKVLGESIRTAFFDHEIARQQ